MLGSVGSSYAVSGSFSRSAVNSQAGAVSGLSSVVTSVVVVITLLFFTPLLYHLPLTVLVTVIMMAVFSKDNIYPDNKSAVKALTTEIHHTLIFRDKK